jgi:hypothetical protein
LPKVFFFLLEAFLESDLTTTACPRPIPFCGIQKTFSAGPCSFSFQRALVRNLSAAASNPFLTHVTVESPIKSFLHSHSLLKSAAASNQS